MGVESSSPLFGLIAAPVSLECLVCEGFDWSAVQPSSSSSSDAALQGCVVVNAALCWS